MYVIALRGNGGFDGREIEAWVGEIDRPYGIVYGAVREPAAYVFESYGAAEYTLRRLSDEFFDRFAPEILGVPKWLR